MLHAEWFISDTVKLRLDTILGSVSYFFIVKVSIKDKLSLVNYTACTVGIGYCDYHLVTNIGYFDYLPALIWFSDIVNRIAL